MKVKLSKIFEVLILALIICECDFFRILKLPKQLINLGIFGIMMVCAILCICYKVYKKCTYQYGNFVFRYCFIVLIFLIFEFFYTSFIYHEVSLRTFISYSRCYLYVFTVIPILFIFLVDGNIVRSLDRYSLLTVAALLFMLIFTYVYNHSGRSIFPAVSYYMDFHTRNNRLRLYDLAGLQGLVTLYSFHRMIFYKSKKSLLFFTISIISLLYVQQTRMFLLIIAMCCVFTSYMCWKKNTTENWFKKILLTALIVFAGSVLMSPFLETFSLTGENHASTLTRLLELRFVAETISKRGFFGIGLISDDLRAALYYKDVYKFISLDDIGIIGQFCLIGIWIIPIYIYPMIRMAKIILKQRYTEDGVFLMSLYLFLCFTSVTLMILDYPRILGWPFCLALFEYYNYQNAKKNSIMNEI